MWIRQIGRINLSIFASIKIKIKKNKKCTFVNDMIQIFCKNDSINIELFSLLNIK